MQGDFPPRGPRFNDFPGPRNFLGPGGQNQTGPGLLGPPPMYQGPGQQFRPPQMTPGPVNLGPPREMGPPIQPLGGPHRFMGPGMPPGLPPGVPMIDPTKEVWVETTSDQGKVYYYHSKTRQSIWKKPEDDNIQIITQAEANALAAATAAGLVPPLLGPGPNRGPVQNMPAQDHQESNRDNQLYHTSEQGPMNLDNNKDVEKDVEASMQGPFDQGPQDEQKPPVMAVNLGPGPGGPGPGPRFGLPGIGAPGPMPPRMPGLPGPGIPFGGPMPFMGPPMMMPGGTVWRAHKAPDGRTYYYNITTMETQWNKPKELEDLDSANEKTEDDKKNEEELAEGESAPKRARFGEDDSKKSPATTNNHVRTEEEKAKERQKPVATEPVPGTPWCIVWTGDEKVFFYNPTTKLSMWERPDELKGRSDIDKILADPPHKRKEDTSTESVLPGQLKPKGAEESLDGDVAQSKKKAKKSTDEGNADDKVSVPAVPLDERMKHFKDMLYERQVSAFSTWDKELHKIVFDPRYTMLNPKERKQVFESYVKIRADEERKEKKAHLLKVKEEFKQLLDEAKVHNRMSFSEFAGKHGKEPRFKAIDKMKEREALYHEFLKEAKNKKTTEAKEKTAKIRSDFMDLLEEKRVEKYSRWSRVYEKIHSDLRYAAVNSTMLREEMWREYLEKKQSEKKHKSGDDDNEEAEKKRRTEESMKARVEQVEKEKAERSREIDSERQKHKQDEAIQHFKALLSDMVRNTDQTWSEARRQLRKEPRWGLASLLSKDEKEKFYEEHLDALNKRKRFSFRKLLEEAPQIELTSTWKEVRKMIKEDPRFSKFSSSDRKREREFEDVMKDKRSTAKSEFRDLLRETKVITHKSKELTKSNPQHMKEVIAILENDKRYLVMECMAKDRDDLIYYYMDDLHRKGPPPPPTATEPSRRLERK